MVELWRFASRQISVAYHFLVFPSDLTIGVFKQLDDSDWPRDLIPERRGGDSEDVTGIILFLVSRAGAYINGNVLIADGGRLGVVPSSY